MKYNNKKYKVVNAKVNKQLINDELTLNPIKSKKPKPPVCPGPSEPPKPTLATVIKMIAAV